LVSGWYAIVGVAGWRDGIGIFVRWRQRSVVAGGTPPRGPETRDVLHEGEIVLCASGDSKMPGLGGGAIVVAGLTTGGLTVGARYIIIHSGYIGV